MVGIVLSDEQVKSAPQEVKRWLYSLMEATLQPGHDFAYDRGGFRYAGNDLAVCDPHEVLRIFSLLKDDPISSQCFLRLGKDNYDRTTGRHVPTAVPLEALQGNVASLPGRITESLETINRALRSVRGDPRATLFLQDRAGRLVVHETTQWNIHLLLQHLMEAGRRAQSISATYSPLSCAPPYHIENGGSQAVD